MSIKRRVRVKLAPKKPKNLIAEAVLAAPARPRGRFAVKLHSLYNRLQAGDPCTDTLAEVLDCAPDQYAIITAIINTCDAKIETRDSLPGKCYQVGLHWQDTSKPAIYGHFRPTLTTVISSQSLYQSATLAYAGLSKQAGKFV